MVLVFLTFRLGVLFQRQAAVKHAGPAIGRSPSTSFHRRLHVLTAATSLDNVHSSFTTSICLEEALKLAGQSEAFRRARDWDELKLESWNEGA